MKIFLLGSPGSGKTSVSELLMESLSDYRYYDVGAILREQAANDEHIREVHAAGGIVNSDRVLNIFEDALSQQNAFVCGSPRKPGEASFILSHDLWKQSPGYLIDLDVSDEIAKARLSKRGRFDDGLDVVNERFRVYKEETKESVKLFQEANRVIRVDATGTPEEVRDTILYAISRLSC